MTVPAVRLAALATRLRDLADKATPGPWAIPAPNVFRVIAPNAPHTNSAQGRTPPYPWAVVCDTGEEPTAHHDARFIATMNPSVALALADLVDAAVNDHAAIYEADCYCREGATCDNLDALLPLADLILGPEGTA